MSLNKNYLWNNFKKLKNHAEIFIDEMTLEKENTPDKYVVIEKEVYDRSSSFGDGTTLLRKNDFNIRIHASNLEDIDRITDHYSSELKRMGLNYSIYSTILDQLSGRYSKLITSSYLYD